MPKISQLPVKNSMGSNDVFVIDTFPFGPSSSGIISKANAGVGGDMLLGTAQTVTAAKTFNIGTLLDKGEIVFDVKAYGAVGNGSTDDTTAIQNAINAAHAIGGGIVYFPIGLYKLTAALTGYSNIWYLGAASSQTTGGGSCLNQTGANVDGIRFTNTTDETTNVVIANLRIQGPGVTTGHGIYLKNTGSGGVYQPFTYFTIRDVYIANFKGAGACGLNMEGAIVSTFSRVVCEICTNGFLSNGQVTGSRFSSTATSLHFESCYADGCQAGTGFDIRSTVYSSFSNCAADSCGTAYSLLNCNALSFLSCGSEWGSPDTSSPGDGFKVNACLQITFSTPYTFQNYHYSFWVTGNSNGITFIGPQENSPVSATHSLIVDTGSQATILNPNFTTAVSQVGIVSYLDDGSGGMAMPGTGFFGGNLIAGSSLEVDNQLKLINYNGIWNTNGDEIMEFGAFGTAGTNVNHIGTEASPAGSGPDIYAAGPDTDITLTLIPKGAGVVSVANHRISTVVDPTLAQDAATKNYVDTHTILRSINVVSTATNAGAAANTDYVYSVTGATTITLPTAAGNTNLYMIKNNDATLTTTVATVGGQTIDGTSTKTLATQYSHMTVVSNGSSWMVVG